MELTATLVVYNGMFNIIANTIESFLQQNIKSYLLLVNNSSPYPDLIAQLESFIKNKNNVKMISAPTNLGFGKAHNLGFAHLQEHKIYAPYHLVLNPDIITHQGCLSYIIKYMDANKKVGLAVPKVLNPDGTIQYLNKEYPAIFDLFMRRFLPRFIRQSNFFQKRHNYYTRQTIGYDQISDVPFPSGCFMVFRTEIFIALKGFDERYFMYMEDVDVSRRCHNIAEVKFLPQAVITHYWARESHSNWKMTLVMIKSAIKYYAKFGFTWW